MMHGSYRVSCTELNRAEIVAGTNFVLEANCIRRTMYRGQIVTDTNCIRNKYCSFENNLYHKQIVLGTIFIVNKLYREQMLSGTTGIGNKLYRKQIVSETTVWETLRHICVRAGA
jgi:hypothetical protein